MTPPENGLKSRDLKRVRVPGHYLPQAAELVDPPCPYPAASVKLYKSLWLLSDRRHHRSAPLQESGGDAGGAEPGRRLWRFLVLIAVGRSAYRLAVPVALLM